jgi:hypothetical protein
MVRMTNDQFPMTNDGLRGDGLQCEISNLKSHIGHWSLVIGHLASSYGLSP